MITRKEKEKCKLQYSCQLMMKKKLNADSGNPNGNIQATSERGREGGEEEEREEKSRGRRRKEHVCQVTRASPILNSPRQK